MPDPPPVNPPDPDAHCVPVTEINGNLALDLALSLTDEQLAFVNKHKYVNVRIVLAPGAQEYSKPIVSINGPAASLRDANFRIEPRDEP